MAIIEPRAPVAAPAGWTIRDSPEAVDGSVWGAAFRTENIVGSLSQGLDGRGDYLNAEQYNNQFGRAPDPTFNPWTAIEGTEYEQFFDSFAGARSTEETQLIMGRVDREQRDRQILAQSGGAGFAASMVAGFVDVPTLIPAFGAMRGGNVLRSALTTSAYAGAESLAVEAVLHQTQQTRTVEESQMAVGGSIVLGGILGGVVGAFRRTSVFQGALRRSADAMDGRAVPAEGTDLDLDLAIAEGRDLSAAAVTRPLPEDFELPTRAATMVANSTPSGFSFTDTGRQAQALTAKSVFNDLLENPFAFAGVDRVNAEPSLSTTVNVQTDRARVNIGDSLGGAYREYAQRLGARTAGGGLLGSPEGVLRPQAFSAQVAGALRRNDEHNIPEVAAAAQRLRSEVLDPLKDRAIAQGLLPDDVDVSTAASYFTRLWDSQSIVARKDEFVSRLAAHFEPDMRAARDAEGARIQNIENQNEAARADAEITSLRRETELVELASRDGVEVSQEQIDGIVESLRRRPPRPTSLLHFLSDAGLSADRGGELASRDANLWHRGQPGVRRLVRDEGVDLDTAADNAYQSGYIASRDTDLLLKHIDDELRGEPVYARADLDDAGRLEAYRAMEEFAESIGISRTGKTFSQDRIARVADRKDLAAKAIAALRRVEEQPRKFPERKILVETDEEIRAYSREAADEVFNTLTGRNNGDLAAFDITVGARGPMKERTLNVKDVDFEDFLINDTEIVLSKYARTMSADIAIKERFGDVKMEQQIRDINTEYDELAKLNPDRQASIEAERARVTKRLEAARDIVRGTYKQGDRAGVPYRVVQSAMTYNFIRGLGGLVTSALSDPFRLTMTHGANHVFGAAVIPMVRNLKQYRIAASQARELAGIAEVQLNNRLMAMADITDPIGSRTPAEAMLEKMAGWASLLSGGLHWNNFMKGIMTQATTSRLRTLGDSKADKVFRQRLNLNSRDAASIRKAMEDFGEDADGVFDPHAELWPERTRELYATVLRADADNAIVTPGVGDKVPVAEEYFFIKPALQFKSFALAAHRRVLVAGLQEDQTRFLMNAANMAAMGMFIYWLKAKGGGREPSDDPGVWLAEGIDRSGLMPLYFEANNMLESLGVPGIYSIMGGDEASRYAVRGQAGKLLGPTAGLVNDATKAIGALLGLAEGEEITAGDVGSMRRLLPFGRHPGIQQYLDLWVVPELKSRL